MRISDWSSDVCSSDLRDWAVAERLAADGSWQEAPDAIPNEKARPLTLRGQLDKVAALTAGRPAPAGLALATLREAAERSEERRVGKACVSTCRSRGSPAH